MADWQSFTLEVPGKDLLEPVRQVLETLLIFLEVLKAILNTIKAFLIDFGNPIRALVEALIALIEELFLALKAAGFFGYFDIPVPDVDPEFKRLVGGFSAFTTRFKASLYDTKDPNRPQPRAGSTQSGFVLMVVDATDPFKMLNRIIALLRFFGKALDTPRYEAPANFKVTPVGASGDPILAVASVFTDGPIEAIQVSWTLPSTQETPDAGFLDVVAKHAAEFIPPNFVIEKSVDINPVSQKIDLEEMGDGEATGIVEFNRPVNVDPSLAGRFAQSENGKVVRREVLRDDAGEPVIKFQQYIIPGSVTDILGQLGRYRYIDTDVVPGKTYYYRVRAYSGDLDVSSSGQLQNAAQSFQDLKIDGNSVAANSSVPYFSYPTATSDDRVVMGKSTPIIRATLPVATDFDVLQNARKVFLTAFSLDFHDEMPLDSTGLPVKFNPDGTPAPGTPATAVGKGSLFEQAGMLGAYRSTALLEYIAEFDTPEQAFDPANNIVPVEAPWVSFKVRKQAARLADAVTSSMLQHPEAVMTFRDLMRGSFPRGPIDTEINLAGKTNLEEVVFEFTKVEEGDDLDDAAEGLLTGGGAGGTVSRSSFLTYLDAYDDVPLRLNILTIVNFFKTFTLGGVPVDWISIQPLRDIIPWSGQFLYDLLDKIDALLAAFNGLIEEIRQFIDMLIRKIEVLESFIQFLIDILNFIESLSLDFYLLNVTGLSGDAFSWVEAIDTAGGDIPPSGPDGYSAGICLGYVAPNIDAFVAAFSIIFGA